MSNTFVSDKLVLLLPFDSICIEVLWCSELQAISLLFLGAFLAATGIGKFEVGFEVIL